MSPTPSFKENYFQVPVSGLIPGKDRSFPLYIYFELNDHFMLRFGPDYDLSGAVLQSHLRRGIEQLWCPVSFKAEWERYSTANASQIASFAEKTQKALLATPASAPGDEAAPAAPASEATPDARPRSEEAALAVDVMTSPKLDPEQKRALLSEIGAEMLNNLVSVDGENPEQFKENMAKCKGFADDVVKVAAQSVRMSSVLEDLQLLSEQDIEHSTAVATLAVIFALGTGYSEPQMLTDIAFASFLHDVGCAFMDPTALGIPVTALTPEQFSEYRKHVALGLEFLEKTKAEVSPAVKKMIEQHHERFDGQGYPKKLVGLAIDEMAQLLLMADLLSDLITGAFDGTAKSPLAAVEQLRALQGPSGNPAYFNPEIFASVMQMLGKAKELTEDANQMVSKAASGF